MLGTVGLEGEAIEAPGDDALGERRMRSARFDISCAPAKMPRLQLEMWERRMDFWHLGSGLPARISVVQVE